MMTNPVNLEVKEVNSTACREVDDVNSVSFVKEENKDQEVERTKPTPYLGGDCV